MRFIFFPILIGSIFLTILAAAKVPSKFSAAHPDTSFFLRCESQDKKLHLEFIEEVESSEHPLLLIQNSNFAGKPLFTKLGPPNTQGPFYWYDLWESWGVNHLWNDEGHVFLELSETVGGNVIVLELKLSFSSGNNFDGNYLVRRMSFDNLELNVVSQGSIKCAYSVP